MATTYTFYGDPKHRPKNAHQDSPTVLEPYKASSELIKAVNLAIYLERPLLLEGEAGCGKTRLAHAVAYELGLPLYRWDVRSTSTAKEGLYTYDSILRLHDVQVRHLEGDTPRRDPSDPTRYRAFGPLGKAFQLKDRPAVVLIDEIDKADLDFPNDLLAVLEKPWEFEIPETDEVGKNRIQANPNCPPIVIITSNKEKGNLPMPFLRRCIYHLVQFPDAAQLKEIVNIHYCIKDSKAPSSKLVGAAIQRFEHLREKGGLHKKPGTSEFLDWIDVLQNFDTPPYKASQIEDVDSIPPYPEVLYKLRADWPRRDHVSP